MKKYRFGGLSSKEFASDMINEYYRYIKDTYLFANVASKARAYAKAHPEADLIEMSVGDVTRPLPSGAAKALAEAAAEMSDPSTFRGYGPEQGYTFLREAIRVYYASRGIAVECDEIFVSDGAKRELGNLLELFSEDATAVVADPAYPVYVDVNRMAGRRIIFLEGTEENGFLPMPTDDLVGDLIYLCSPANPTGAAYNRTQLTAWVDFANKNGAVILYDAAYEAFLEGEEDLPRSIFEIEGARRCAIEICSFSQTAGFTGMRCGYTVIPHELEREGFALRRLWLRRQIAKCNGVSYPIQRAAAAALSWDGRRECRENIAYYKENARLICECLRRNRIWFAGGKYSPYIWMKCPNGMKSWDFFDLALEEAHIIGLPGVGYGEAGEGYFRLSSFGNRERTEEGLARLEKLFARLRTVRL